MSVCLNCFQVCWDIEYCELCDIKMCSSCMKKKNHTDDIICEKCHNLACYSKCIPYTHTCWNCYTPSKTKLTN